MSLPDIRRNPPGALLFSGILKNMTIRENSLIARRVLLPLAFIVACGKGDQAQTATASSTAQTAGSVDLTGAGATFPYPIYSKWFSDYAKATGVKINYQSI